MPRKGNYEPVIRTPAEIEATNQRLFDIGRAALGDALISASALGTLPLLAEDPTIMALSEKYAAGYPVNDGTSS